MTATTSGPWDCHVHVFDPVRFPFRSTRAYTPSPASVDDLLNDTQSTGIVLAQASPEDGHHGLTRQLEEAKSRYPGMIFRAEIMTTQEPPELDVARLPSDTIDTLHGLGVWLVHCHADGPGSLPRYARCTGVGDGVIPDIVGLVAEHGACARPSDFGSPDFESFVAPLRTGRVYVEISALYRRAPENFRLMRDVVLAYAQAAPDRILWGPDWPHVDASRGGLDPTPPDARANWREELDAVREWITEEQFTKMLPNNQAKLYS
ncbi:hypothetical protein BKA67DRAFT_664708 [Truncatella angustata]|uniref:Amidohydrolase-related domain-containing protein n=1 Tax=Truncatella angustata TaxID=152316 RepID=A0A9P8RH13_9PEZI|nr:uncharacterized protein BKA67DRAFT_664708 [Truncatella angustata]KAH6645687.1 hypothetical protein BKA67DRAFT_664708 [Truncatella angustata]KAH8194160.1 hypothetical protein TruAng_011672 [Truncatella angustata]